MADGGWPAVNSGIPAGLETLGLQLPAVADGVWHPNTGASVALGSDTPTVGTAAFTAADIGKRFTMVLGGSPVSFAGAKIVARGTNYRAGDAITVAGSPANVWSVTCVGTPAIVSGGSGGPPNATFLVRGTTPGRRGRRDAARVTVTTNASGVVTGIVRVEKSGVYVDPLFYPGSATTNSANELFESRDYPGLTGLSLNLTLGVNEVRRRAACFYGRITDGTTLTVEELVYGTIAIGNTLSGIEVIEGTTITAGAGLAWTISTAHSGMQGNVFLFVAETRTLTTSPASGTVSATGGSGSGLTLTPEWRGTPLVGNILDVLSPTQIRLDVAAASAATSVGYCYGTDHGPAIQAALDAGQEVNLPAGVICHSTPLVFKNKSRFNGESSALGNNANTILAYVGPYSSRGKQLSGDIDVSGDIDGCVIGNLLLLGNNLIGIGLFTKGVQGSQFQPMGVRAHTYIGVQLSGALGGANVGNIHSHLVVREIDSPGWDTTGIYIGPGEPTGSLSGVNDTCRTLFPYWQVDVEATDFARAIWYRTADSNSHGFVKARGGGDLPTIEFAGYDDDRNYFARAIHFNYLDSDRTRLRGGAHPALVSASYQNLLNGGTTAELDDTPDFDEEPDPDDPDVIAEVGARYFGITTRGALIAPRLFPFKFASRQQPSSNTWMLYPVNDANTNVPGAEITGTGSYRVLAYTDAAETLRVLSPLSLPAAGTYTVATLPVGRAGMRAIVSDATAPAFLAAPVGGGAVRSPVFWDDSGAGAWKIG